jgi:hypothetical protein
MRLIRRFGKPPNQRVIKRRREAGRHSAPNTGLILYPKYPEVRMSGFLLGCKAAPAEIMRVRDAGRIIILGITRQGEVMGYAATANDPVTAELNAHDWPMVGVFLELPLTMDQLESPKNRLLNELRRIYQLHWIASQKLAANGTKAPYPPARTFGPTRLCAETQKSRRET